MFRPPTEHRRGGWPLAVLVALLWAVLPLLPALIAGKLVGSPYTDLYPSAWGLAVFAEAQPGLPLSTPLFGAPGAQGFYYSSPLHGWVGAPLHALFGPVVAYNTTLVLARAATVLAAFGWLRALRLAPVPAIAGALFYGASPFFHGYTVEGIVEGTDGWALPLWAWMVARGHSARALLACFLCIFSSWYLGMVACGLAALAGYRLRAAWWSLGGLLLALPFLLAFGSAFGGNTPLSDEVRVAMSAPLRVPTPSLLSRPNPFAITTYVGWTTVLLAALGARSRPGLALGALGCFVLSTGRGPWWDLPVLELVRFPYRWHAGTLLCLAPLVASAPWRGLAFIPWVEGLLASPVDIVPPGAPVDVPAIYDRVSGPVLLEFPGPYAALPGQPNASRPRARYYLWAQLTHGAASPWSLDFNGIATTTSGTWREQLLAFDTDYRRISGLEAGTVDWDAARADGVTQVMVHAEELGDSDEAALESSLVAAGATLLAAEGQLSLWAL